MARDRRAKKGHDEETGKEAAVNVQVNLPSQDLLGADSVLSKKGKKVKKKGNVGGLDDIPMEAETSVFNNAIKKESMNLPNGYLYNEDLVENIKSKKEKKLRFENNGDHTHANEKVNINSQVVSAKIDMAGDKPLKKQKAKEVNMLDSDNNDIAVKTKDRKKNIKRNAIKEISSEDDELVLTENIQQNTEKLHTKEKRSKTNISVCNKESNVFETRAGFQLLNIEGDDFDDEMEDISSITEVDNKIEKNESKEVFVDKDELKKVEGKTGKKSKKKERKKKDYDEEGIEKFLEELALEIKGQQPAVSKLAAGDSPDVTFGETSEKQGKKKKKRGETEMPENKEASSDVNVHEIIEKQDKKKRRNDPEIKSEIWDKKEVSLSPETVADDDQHTVKTAAQKKKEKKEREKQKKFEQAYSKKKFEESESQPKKQHENPTILDGAERDLCDIDGDKLEVDAEDKKKKKKKKDDDEKKEKKRPGKKQIAAMQEALKKVKEQEERVRLEIEEKIRAEEAAEDLRLEKLRLEQEKKEKKKQKEKEKRDRLKAEGKLLTKTQRQNRARMEATLAALREQGVEVPIIGEKKERAARLGDRKRLIKKKTDVPEGATKEETEVAGSSSEAKDESPETNEYEEGGENKDVDNDLCDEDVKDAWDASSSEDEESEQSSKMESTFASNGKHSNRNDDDTESEDSSSEESDSEESSSESEAEDKKNDAEKARERAIERIKRRRDEAEDNRSVSKLRSPVVCVLGHVDTGKTKILDRIRRTHVQDSEAGGITQQIGATMVPQEALKEQCKMVKNFADMELKLPGLLIIDTPGHESFSNLRSRGSSLCDIAVLVVDIMHGLEPQTIESLNLLKQKKTPFIVALNKVDRLYEWKTISKKDIQDVIKGQARNTKLEFEDRVKDVILQFANQSMNAVLFYENQDPRSYISMVPTSALTGDGMGNLMALIVQLTQSMMAKKIAFSEELQATVLEVKAIPGLGTTIDVILVNGRLTEGDTVVLAGHEGAMVTQIRSLLMPQPLKELRVKNMYQEFKEVEGAQGVKITGKDLDKAIAGLQMLVAHQPDEIVILKEEVTASLKEAMSHIKLAERGVYVQASTLGSLEALLEFLKVSKIPYAGIRIGPVVKKDVMKASVMLEHDSQYAVILAFDVKIERDAQDLADSLGLKIFQADIIYHLFDKFMAYREELKTKKRDEFKSVAVFPCKLRILPQYVFNSRDPIVLGVIVEAGVVKDGTPLCVPTKEFLDIGTVTTIEVNHKQQDSARKGQEVCVKIESGGDTPKMYGRHFDHTDCLVSKITRQSIDVCKEYFRDDLQKTDWQLMVELKKTFQIL